MNRTRLHLAIACSVVFLMLVAAPAFSQVQGTKHDLSSTGPGATSNVTRHCVFCHTPHQATEASGQDPLWNHTLSSNATYGVYDSDTMDATPDELGGATPGTASVSNLCLSCHDGTIGVGSLYNDPNEVTSVTITDGGNVSGGLITGDPNVGTNLTDDHPINFTYDSTLATTDGELETPVSTAWVDSPPTVPLFGGTVQCASCHDAHDNTYPAFMVRDNTNSALCTTCHQK